MMVVAVVIMRGGRTWSKKKLGDGCHSQVTGISEITVVA